MSRKGNYWNNACVESFSHSLKVEEITVLVQADNEEADKEKTPTQEQTKRT